MFRFSIISSSVAVAKPFPTYKFTFGMLGQPVGTEGERERELFAPIKMQRNGTHTRLRVCVLMDAHGPLAYV